METQLGGIRVLVSPDRASGHIRQQNVWESLRGVWAAE